FLPPGYDRPVDEIDILHSEDSKLLRRLDCSNPAAFRQFAQAMLEGERYRPQYDDVVEVQTEIYAFRAPDGADVHAAITMRRSDVEAVVDAYGSVTLNAAVAFIDTVARATSRSERTLQFRLPDSAATHVLLNASVHTQLHGELDVRVTVEDPARRIGRSEERRVGEGGGWRGGGGGRRG